MLLNGSHSSAMASSVPVVWSAAMAWLTQAVSALSLLEDDAEVLGLGARGLAASGRRSCCP